MGYRHESPILVIVINVLALFIGILLSGCVREIANNTQMLEEVSSTLPIVDQTPSSIPNQENIPENNMTATLLPTHTPIVPVLEFSGEQL